VADQTGLSYMAEALLPNTMYYWRIDEVNGEGTTSGITWEFTTGSNVQQGVNSASVVIPDAVRISLDTVSGRSYRLERSEGSTTNWTFTGMSVVGDGGTMSLYDSSGATASRSFRVTTPLF
jgi:hypothetical protein